MKKARLHVILAAALLATGAADAAGDERAPAGDRLFFVNGDRLQGRMVRIESGTGLTWQHPAVADAAVFTLDNVRRILLGGYRLGVSDGTAAAVRLTNDDLLTGTIVRLTADHLVLDTSYGGRIEIRRPMVHSIRPGTAGGILLYEGPTGPEGWTTGRPGAGGWEYRANAFYASNRASRIGRVFEGLPDTASVDFDFAWKGQPSLSVAVLADRIESPGGNACVIVINGDYVACQRQTANMGSQEMGNVQLQGLSARGSAKLSVRFDRANRQIALFVDGTLARQWTDTADFPGAGNGLIFQSNNAHPMRISNIRVARWSGSFETPMAGEREARQDVIRFNNGDTLAGQLAEIKDGTISFKTEFANLNVPLDRAGQIAFNPDGLERARRNRGDVEAHLSSGERLTLRLESIGPTGLVGDSENFGGITVTRAALRELRFNLYDERRDEDDGEEAW